MTRLGVALRIIKAAPNQFRVGFNEWLMANWHLYERFESEARTVAAHRDHYSAYTIIEYLRHETFLRDLTSGDFKLNQAWSSSVSRLFAHLNPSLENFLEFRVRRGGVVADFRPLEEVELI
jgi:hypothetical protein